MQLLGGRKHTFALPLFIWKGERMTLRILWPPLLCYGVHKNFCRFNMIFIL